MGFEKKLALVTGGSSGIGLATAKKLCSAGANVIILARDPQKLAAACEEIKSFSNSADQQVGAVAVDITDTLQVNQAVEQLVQSYGAPDLLINAAGVTHPGKFIELDADIFRWMMETNYFGTINVIKAVVPHLISHGAGHIVNFSSIAGFLGIYGYSAYGPSKFAIRGLSDSLRTELAEHNICVSIVFPPDTQTPQLEYETPFKPPVLVELDKNNKILTAEAVADSILNGIARRRYVITPGFDSSLYFQLTNTFSIMYPLMDWMVAQANRAVRRTKENGSAKNER